MAIPAREQIFNLAALTVFCSIIVHGLSDSPGAAWIARHAERAATQRAALAAAAGAPAAGPPGRGDADPSASAAPP
jgi:NhaP-type Na+/H+ or K+/H+ antiporter